MREESHYRPAVVSAGGAIGLMQIIPPTGQEISQALQVNDFKPKNLENPNINIRFGTYYLKSLLERYQGSWRLAVAAYNAGPTAVDRWRKRQRDLADDAFVESIPFDETRRYLRRVARSRQIYRLLYEELDGA